MLPLPGVEGALVLGADQARAFKGDDISWARTIALSMNLSSSRSHVPL